MKMCNKPPKGTSYVMGSGYLDVCPYHGIRHLRGNPVEEHACEGVHVHEVREVRICVSCGWSEVSR